MAWMNMLYQTYEANAHMVGQVTQEPSLAPVAHMTANAQIELLVDESGNFCGAHVVEKENAKTIIPVTEKSASRSSGDAPHALCDTLSYVAGDFSHYLSNKKSAKTAEKRFTAYFTELEKWAHSSYTHPKVRAIYTYINKKQMTYDLIHSGIIECSDDEILIDKKLNGTAYEKAIVRFRILDNPPDAVWQDESLFTCYTQYYMSFQKDKNDVCYLTGKKGLLSVNHPKGIIAANYGAKLISANDESNFTFRGRFISANEACTIGYEATQKAHHALIWLAAKQGVSIGNKKKRTYICWNPLGKKVANIQKPFGLEDDSAPKSYTEEEYKKHLYKTFCGFQNELDNNDDIVVIGLDAATTGRLSVTYYNELKSSDFYDRLTNWGETCCWYFTKFTPEKKPYTTVWTPLTKLIILSAFGTQQGKILETSDQILKEQSQRILHCMLDKQPLPIDIVHAATQRASMPLAYSHGNHEKILSTACALIKKYYSDRAKGVKIKMTLDYKNENRSYLFGRLLAVLEKAERSTFSRDETRETNAIRLQSAYINHPMSTWKTLETALNPYFQRMMPGSRKYYKDLISEIIEKVAVCQQEYLNRPLEDIYLIGYYLQRAELNKYYKKSENNKEDSQL